VLDALGPIGRRWPRVLEPTCGRGHFLAGLLGRPEPPREIKAIEIQADLAASARGVVGETAVTHANLFDLDLRRDLCWRESGPLLVLGNPPWVTNAELGVLASGNLPRKWNVKGARGLDARTGASNFDIAEAIWLKLIDEFSSEAEPVTIALLCKMSVARNVLEHAERRALPIAEASLSRIEARRWFGAEVDACLFRLSLGPDARADRVPVFADLGATAPIAEIGFARGRLVTDLPEWERWAFADGVCPLTWRQGLKHDAAAVMELIHDNPYDPQALRNKQGMVVEVEPSYVYPLLKGADLAGAPRPRPGRAVIVTQTRIGQDTRALEQTAPRLWGYLSAHASVFDRRKSSIYQGRTPYAMFGIGPYSFASYKVAVSGLHKSPSFRAIGPIAGRPVMFDDTSCFLACRSPEQAALVSAILEDEATRNLLGCLTFRDAKRPITKTVLRRLDLAAIADRADRAVLLARADTIFAGLVDPGAGGSYAWPASLRALLKDPAIPDVHPTIAGAN
jgi:hypothetical protein